MAQTNMHLDWTSWLLLDVLPMGSLSRDYSSATRLAADNMAMCFS